MLGTIKLMLGIWRERKHHKTLPRLLSNGSLGDGKNNRNVNISISAISFFKI